MRIFPEVRLFEGRRKDANLGLDEFLQQYLWVVCSGLDFLGRTQVRDVWKLFDALGPRLGQGRTTLRV